MRQLLLVIATCGKVFDVQMINMVHSKGQAIFHLEEVLIFDTTHQEIPKTMILTEGNDVWLVESTLLLRVLVVLAWGFRNDPLFYGYCVEQNELLFSFCWLTTVDNAIFFKKYPRDRKKNSR